MKIYQLKTTQILSISLESAWSFFSNPANLSKIAPPWLNFKTKTVPADKMYAGMIITYLVRPILNIPQTWVTEITYVDKPNYFVDEQRFGPYKMWHHEHFFTETKNGKVEMLDIVSYVVPFGFLGRIMNALVVKNKINEIFNYRKKVLNEMFGNNNSDSN
jgi:ligand-binding SRPBCC domain-containing protein